MPLTRRAFLAATAATPAFAAASQPKLFPAEWTRFADPATEWEVIRLTNPQAACHLPAYYNRIMDRRGASLLFWSDRTGTPQAFRMNLRTGEFEQITEARQLEGDSLTLLPDDRSVCFFAGDSLHRVTLNNLRQREIARLSPGWSRCPGSSVSRDGSFTLFGETRNSTWRLRQVSLSGRRNKIVIQVPFAPADPLANPRRGQILYRQNDEALWLVDSNGRQNRKLSTAPGRLGPALWSPDGRTLVYLLFPEDKTRLHEIREHTPDENLDKLIAPTSQFMQLGMNSDGSVFVGASRNLNSPHILILLRLTRRELTVCEHKASDPLHVNPMFSPDNRQILFESDKHGKSAIYRVRVEKFVEPTEEEDEKPKQRPSE
jgi:oligogalacturonide lyase